MKRLALAVAILIALIESAWPDYLVGLRAYVRGDHAAALLEWRPLAEQGNAQAQFYLGDIYEWGLGVPQDYTEAVKWYRKAADQGHAIAQNNLGVMYENGRGVPQDYVRAHMWFSLAASRFAPGSNRDITVRNRERVAAKMTPAQFAEAQRLARE